MQDPFILDEIDLALVNALQVAPRASWSVVGQVLGITPTTAARRWDRNATSGAAWVTAYPWLSTWARHYCLAFVDVDCRPAAAHRVVQPLAARRPGPRTAGAARTARAAAYRRGCPALRIPPVAGRTRRRPPDRDRARRLHLDQRLHREAPAQPGRRRRTAVVPVRRGPEDHGMARLGDLPGHGAAGAAGPDGVRTGQASRPVTRTDPRSRPPRPRKYSGPGPSITPGCEPATIEIRKSITAARPRPRE
ncbi:AsnC family protein [Streptomyces phyllanthi]|uniref:AsnC family protein n=1 Tax=Streptomyces phyllanthi TaxID=1803180 RepID=UPI0018846E97